MRKTTRLLAIAAIAALSIATPGFGWQAQYYVLDGFGGVHAGGGAPGVGGTPYFGFDIAKGISHVATRDGEGVLVLDGFGGVHASAGLVVAAPTPYFGFDVARAIAFRNVPPRVASASGRNAIDLETASATFTVIDTTTITAPDDGFLFVVGSVQVLCVVVFADQNDQMAANVTVNVDATIVPDGLVEMGLATFPDCVRQDDGTFNSRTQTIAHLFPVSAGAHTVNLLGRKRTGDGTTRFLDRSLTAVFIDQGPSVAAFRLPNLGGIDGTGAGEPAGTNR